MQKPQDELDVISELDTALRAQPVFQWECYSWRLCWVLSDVLCSKLIWVFWSWEMKYSPGRFCWCHVCFKSTWKLFTFDHMFTQEGVNGCMTACFRTTQFLANDAMCLHHMQCPLGWPRQLLFDRISWLHVRNSSFSRLALVTLRVWVVTLTFDLRSRTRFYLLCKWVNSFYLSEYYCTCVFSLFLFAPV